MKTARLNRKLLLELINGFKATGRWVDIEYGQCKELYNQGEEGILILHEDGAWQLRTVGDKFAFDEYDSTAISGPLSSKDLELVSEIFKKAKPADGDLDLMDILHSK